MSCPRTRRDRVSAVRASCLNGRPFDLPGDFEGERRRGNPLYRAWLDGAMRGGIPDRQAREHTFTPHLEKAAFRQALDLPHEETIYSLVLDHGGHVLWRGQGMYTERVGRELERVLAEGL